MGLNLSRFLFATFVLLLSLIVSTGGQATIGATNFQSSVYDRVIKSGTIRCGYLLYPPYCMEDPNTGKLTGIFVEVMEMVGKRLGLKVIWSDEVGYESLFEGLRSNRFDIFAGGLWPNADRAKVADFSIPIFYSAFKAYGRTSENRFQGNLQAINSPKITIAVLDGAMEDLIAKSDFPRAKRLSLPQLCPFSQNLLNIITKKADVTFAEPGIVSLFLKSNPNTLKELAPNKPLRIFGNTYVFKIGEMTFKNMINTVLEELINSGEIEKLIRKYELCPGAFYRVAAPYQMPSNARLSKVH